MPQRYPTERVRFDSPIGAIRWVDRNPLLNNINTKLRQLFYHER